MDNQIHVSIFWTGGYDSTFRVCQLSRKNVIITPYYLSDNRASEQMELKAIDLIRDKLINNPNTIAAINPLQYVSKDSRKTDDRITQAFNKLLKQDFMGSQYEWLGVFALEHQGIELSIHKDDKAIALINKHGALKLQEDEYGTYYVVDTSKSSQELITLFGNQRFPLADYTKVQMKQEYISMGLADIIDDTWFCHTPIDEKPCGICNPCRYTIEEGMPERFSEEALMRYKRQNSAFYKCLRKTKNVLRAIKNRMKNTR